ncbi:MAG: DUF2232 domain-containing protein [Solobacterium sp.]|nr:DUF2232 domain-containing protein [Solobacterium sp.]
MNNNVRKLTDGAMMCAIVGVVLLINRQFGGLFEDMFLFLFPIPMVFYSAKYGWKDSIIVLIAMCLIAFMLGSFVTLFYVGSESLIGLVYGNGIYTHQNSHRLVLITMFMGAVVNVLSTVVFASFFGYDIAAETKELETMMGNIFAQSGAEIPATINLGQYIRTIFVVTAILTGVLQGFVTHVLSRLLLKRMRFNVEPPTPVALYFPPKWSGYLGFLGFCMYYYSVYRPLPNELAQNLFQGVGMCGFLYLLIYGYIGLIVVLRIRNPKLRGVGMLLGLLAMFVMPVGLVIFGFLYITTDFHARLLEGVSYAEKNK